MLSSGCKEQSTGTSSPPRVEIVEVIRQNIPVTQEFVGQIYGLFDIPIRPRVEGFLEGIHFREGSMVRKGQLLYTIDPQPFEAKVAGFRGQLAEARTLLTKAESDLERIRPLAEMNAVSQSDLDAAIAQRDAAMAGVEAAEASLESARIELGYTRIYSPINGIIGKTEAYAGDFVGRGMMENKLNEVSRIDTVMVDFHMPESQYLEIVRPLLEGRDSLEIQRSDTARGLSLTLADGIRYPQKGMLEFVDRQVNPTTGTLLVRASFPNPSRILRPGQFARIGAVIEWMENGLLLPQRCIRELQGTYTVFVVGEDLIVEEREVEVGQTFGTGFWIILSGLNPGERVIYEGLQKVRSGMKVDPKLVEVSIPPTEI
jgi:membrane fusion protein (multidrug efflux system)